MRIDSFACSYLDDIVTALYFCAVLPELSGSAVLFSGAGYGHGMGMSQWGAYAMANEGETAQDIIEYYYNGVTIEKIWE